MLNNPYGRAFTLSTAKTNPLQRRIIFSSLLSSEEKGQLFTVLLRVELNTPEQTGIQSPGAFIIQTKQRWYISSSQRGSLDSGICLCWEAAARANSRAAPRTCFIRNSERGASAWHFGRPSWGSACSLMFDNYWHGRCFDQMWQWVLIIIQQFIIVFKVCVYVCI